MVQVLVGRWGKNLAVRIPSGVAKAAGLHDGEPVEIELLENEIIIRRSSAEALARSQAEAAATEIIAASKHFSLGGTELRELREEGRRG